MPRSPRHTVKQILRNHGLAPDDADTIADHLDALDVLAPEPEPCPARITTDSRTTPGFSGPPRAACYLPAGHTGAHVTGWTDSADGCHAWDDLLGRCDRPAGHPGWHGRTTGTGNLIIWPPPPVDPP